MRYVVIKLTASKINMLQSATVITPAPVFATIMAMHALEKKLCSVHGNAGLGIQGVGIVHEDARPWVEHLEDKNGWIETYINHRRGAYLFDGKPNPITNSMQPMALSDITWTIILACQREPVTDDSLKNMLLSMRLAGGEIREVKVRTYEFLEEAIKNVHSGFWIDDATDIMLHSKKPARDLFAATLQEPWLVPANLGYALLCDPEQRMGSRDGAPHAFAENMVGLLRYTSIHKVRKSITYECFWRYGWDADQFIVTNRKHVNLSAACQIV